MLVIYSHDLLPFAKSLRISCGLYKHSCPRKDYDFLVTLTDSALKGIWEHPARREANLHTYFGEYLRLFLDDPPMIDWIEEWQTDNMPEALAHFEELLFEDSSPVSKRSKKDIQSTIGMFWHARFLASSPQQVAQFWIVYEPLREFYSQHSSEFSYVVRIKIRLLARLYENHLRSLQLDPRP